MKKVLIFTIIVAITCATLWTSTDDFIVNQDVPTTASMVAVVEAPTVEQSTVEVNVPTTELRTAYCCPGWYPGKYIWFPGKLAIRWIRNHRR